MAPTLLTLPPEIRNMIWDYALSSDSGTLYYDNRIKRFDVPSIGAGLMTTCRSTFNETLFAALRPNTLVLDNELVGNVEVWVLLARVKTLVKEMQHGVRL